MLIYGQEINIRTIFRWGLGCFYVSGYYVIFTDLAYLYTMLYKCQVFSLFFRKILFYNLDAGRVVFQRVNFLLGLVLEFLNHQVIDNQHFVD